MVWYGDQKGRANGTWDLQEVLQSRAGDATTLTASPWLLRDSVSVRFFGDVQGLRMTKTHFV